MPDPMANNSSNSTSGAPTARGTRRNSSLVMVGSSAQLTNRLMTTGMTTVCAHHNAAMSISGTAIVVVHERSVGGSSVSSGSGVTNATLDTQERYPTAVPRL